MSQNALVNNLVDMLIDPQVDMRFLALRGIFEWAKGCKCCATSRACQHSKVIIGGHDESSLTAGISAVLTTLKANDEGLNMRSFAGHMIQHWICDGRFSVPIP